MLDVFSFWYVEASWPVWHFFRFLRGIAGDLNSAFRETVNFNLLGANIFILRVNPQANGQLITAYFESPFSGRTFFNFDSFIIDKSIA